jgi:hypothetical protein
MTKLEWLRQFISDYIQGPNADALLSAISEQAQYQDDLSIAVNNQLFISTSSDIYLDKQLSNYDINRPADLGMEDMAFRNMGIKINSVKQLTELIHSVLQTFYGEEAIRAWTQSTKPEPYYIEVGDELHLEIENGDIVKIPFKASDFNNITEATAQEVADVITRYTTSQKIGAHATAIYDLDKKQYFVRVYGAAKGPYSMIRILGGEIQNALEFPVIRDTELLANTTVWQITHNQGNTVRFRWYSGPAPLLSQIQINDNVMIYGSGFSNAGIYGTYQVTNVRPSQLAPSYDSGYFEVTIPEFSLIKSSVPDIAPPPNGPGSVYSVIVSQASNDDLKFFLPKKNTPYGLQRFALAFEPTNKLLKIYMPATTKIVKRGLQGAAHMHLQLSSSDLNGTFGGIDQPFEIVNEYAIKIPQNGHGNIGYGGTLTYGLTTIDIDYISRENGFLLVQCLTPHSLVSNTTIVTVAADNTPEDDQQNQFLGAYMLDPQAKYTLTDTIGYTLDKIVANNQIKTVRISGRMPDAFGYLYFDLNTDKEEGPVPYYGAQLANAPAAVDLASVSQNGNVITIAAIDVHGAVAGSQAILSGLTNPTLNGTFTVISVSDSTHCTLQSPINQIASVVGEGQFTALIAGTLGTLIIDPSYSFKFSHEAMTDVTLISAKEAYTPALDGSDYGFYLTDTAQGRVYAEDIVNQITALGIKMEIVIVYPNGNGLGLGLEPIAGPKNNDVIWIWG